MSDPTPVGAPAGTPLGEPAARTQALRPAPQRGSLRVADKVVEKVTRAAVLGVPGVAPVATTAGTVGRALGRSYPHVACSRSGDRARVRLEVALVWPSPAADVARAVCAAVSDQLLTFAGVHVDEVRTTVARIVDPSDVETSGPTKEPRVR